VTETVTQGHSSVLAMHGSTEEEQFAGRRSPMAEGR